MQIKKEYMYKAIVDAATEEFAAKGFEKGSLRHIAELADTKMSNIYNYFRNKEALYEFIVGDHYIAMRELFDRIRIEGALISVSRQGTDVAAEQWIKFLAPLADRRTELLITASEGTKFAGFRDELEQKMLLAVGLMCGWYPTQPDAENCPVNVYISEYIDSAISVSRKYAGKPNANNIVMNLLRNAVYGFVYSLK